MKALLVLGSLLLSGCGPRVIWKRADLGLELVEAGGRQYLRAEEERWSAHDGIAPASVRRSPRGEVVYAARDGDAWRVYLDAWKSPRFRGIAALKVPSRERDVVFVGRAGRGWWVLDQPSRYGPYEAVGEGSLGLLARDRVIYSARGPKGWSLYVDGRRQGPAFEAISGLQTRPRVPEFAYIGHRDSRSYVVVGESSSSSYPWVQELVLPRRSSSAAWIAGDLDTVALYVDGVLRMGPEAELGGLRVSSDGRHLAVVVRREGKDRIWRDGELGPAFDEILDSTIIVTARGEVGYVARKDERELPVIDGMVRGDFRRVDDFQHRRGWGFIGVDGPSTVHVRGATTKHARAWDLRLGEGGGYVYAAESEAGHWIHRKNRVDGPFPHLVDGTLAVGPEHGRYACLLMREGRLRLLVEGQIAEPYRPKLLIDRMLGTAEAEGWSSEPLLGWLAARADAPGPWKREP